MNIYPAEFEDDDIGDPDGAHQTYHAFLKTLAPFVQITNEVIKEFSEDETHLEGDFAVGIPVTCSSTVFAMCIDSVRNKIDALLNVAEIYERAVMHELGATVEDGNINIRIKKNALPDTFSKQNLFASLMISKHVKTVIRSAKFFLDNIENA